MRSFCFIHSSSLHRLHRLHQLHRLHRLHQLHQLRQLHQLFIRTNSFEDPLNHIRIKCPIAFPTMAISAPIHDEVEAVPGLELWRHPSPESTALYQFKQHISKRYNVKFGSELESNSLWQWSVDNIALFWSEVWDYTNIQSSRGFKYVSHIPAES